MTFSQQLAEAGDRLVANAKVTSFMLAAKVPISALYFDKERCRYVDSKNVQRIKNIFATEGCLRLNKDNYLSALVDPAIVVDSLPNAVQDATGAETLPYIEFPEKSLDCLHGQHRILAAKEHLKEDNQWWVVNLYRKGDSEDVVEKLKRDLVESYNNSKNFCDGEICRNIMLSSDGRGDKKWWARLSSSKARDFRKFLKIKIYRESFRRLLPFRGLWPAIHLGSMNALLGLKCDEEVEHYLKHVYDTWSKLVDGLDPKIVDVETVEMLQSRSMKSGSDRDFILENVRLGNIFSLASQESRLEVEKRLKSYNFLIPTLFTFFEDIKFLGVCYKPLKDLFPLEEGSLRMSAKLCYSGSTPDPRRLGWDIGVEDISCVTGESHTFENGYIQLWLFAMRHFPSLTGTTPKKEKGCPKPAAVQVSPFALHSFAEYASKLGFESANIDNFRANDPVKASIERLVQQLSLKTIDIASPAFNKLLHRVTLEIREAIRNLPTQTPIQISEGSQTAKLSLSDEPLTKRCGRPHEVSHNANKNSLSLPKVTKSLESRAVTSFEVRSTFVRRFWGDLIHFEQPLGLGTPIFVPETWGIENLVETQPLADGTHPSIENSGTIHNGILSLYRNSVEPGVASQYSPSNYENFLENTRSVLNDGSARPDDLITFIVSDRSSTHQLPRSALLQEFRDFVAAGYLATDATNRCLPIPPRNDQNRNEWLAGMSTLNTVFFTPRAK